MGRGKVRCVRCPKFDRGWCLVYAKVVTPTAPMCDFGRKAMRAAENREQMRLARGAKRRYDSK